MYSIQSFAFKSHSLSSYPFCIQYQKNFHAKSNIIAASPLRTITFTVLSPIVMIINKSVVRGSVLMLLFTVIITSFLTMYVV